MKFQGLILLVLMFIPLLSSGQNPLDAERAKRERLKVKALTITKHEYLDGKFDRIGDKSSITTFDPMGRETDRTEFYSGGSVSYKWSFKYDSKGFKSEEAKCYADWRIYNKIAYQYDKRGHVTQQVESHRDGKLVNYKKAFKYNGKGQLIEINEFAPNGSISSVFNFTYDDQGRRITEKEVADDGSISSESKFVYDSKGLLVEESGTNTYGTFGFRNLYKYDDKGNKIEMLQYGPDGKSLVSQTNHKYDNSGNKIEEIGMVKSKFSFKNTFKYDPNGLLIEEVEYSSNEEPFQMIKFNYIFY